MYATASPEQFELYPDEYVGVLLVRQVLPGVGQLGPLFWAAEEVPTGFEEASSREGVVGLAAMDAQTQGDLRPFLADPVRTTTPPS
jgi:hypothetical protein